MPNSSRSLPDVFRRRTRIRSRLRTFAAAGCVACALAAPAARATAQSPVPAPPAAQNPLPALTPGSTDQDRILDAMSRNEHQLWQRMQELTPRIETYMQNFRVDPDLGIVPANDRYYLGLLQFHNGSYRSISFLPDPAQTWRRFIGPIDDTLTQPLQHTLQLDLFGNSFVGMLSPGSDGFDRSHYRFAYVRREFLGEVRCYVFDVAPLSTRDRGAFMGRIWIEDEGDHLVRFNGTFWQNRFAHPDLHFDSWRTNIGPDLWLPTYVYSEESDLQFGLVQHARYQAITQLWGYDLRYAGRQEELTSMSVAGAQMPEQAPPPPPASPVDAARAWEHEAEDNILDRLERAGLLAPEGTVEPVLDQVLDNLMITNQLAIDPPVRCRILLTTPLESVAIGHTIVLSRGLIDSLPDEASLAAMLAHELAHIALGQRLDTQYAFADRMLFADQDAFRLLNLRRTPLEEQRANQLALVYLKNSPYSGASAQMGLFLRQIDARRTAQPHLLSPHLGNPWFVHDYLQRLQPLMAAAPALVPASKTQIAARPLNGRLVLNPWNGMLTLEPNANVPLLSAGEKMPLQVVPMMPYLRRATADATAAGGAGQPPR